MKRSVSFRNALLGLIVLVFMPWASAQQGGQAGSSAGGSISSGSSARRGTARRSGSNSQSSQQQQRLQLFITGSVVLEDGMPPPSGVVIERVCFGRARKEAHLDSSGNFGFQLGTAAIGSTIPDASEDTAFGQSSTWNSSARSFGLPSRLSPSPSMELTGCELRARLAGYRSSVVTLTGGQTQGQMDVGTIVLHPIAKVPGTTVSATEMQAPKEAKKAMERAEKAFRENKLEEAEKSLLMAVAAYPRYATAWFALGQLYEQRRRVENARLAFSKASEADGNYVSPLIGLGRLAAVEQKWQLVADLTDRALALDPLDFPDGFFMNSLAHYSLGNPDAAERSARKAQRLDTSHRIPQVHLILAGLLQEKRDVAGEAEQLRCYLKFAPRAANAGQVQARLQELEMSGVAALGGHPDPR